LMETCEKGQICYDEVDEWMDTEITTIWEDAFEIVKQEIEAATLVTVQTIEESWDAKVICGLEFPCCEYSIEYMANVKSQVILQRSKMTDLYALWAEKEVHRGGLDDLCSDSTLVTCEEMGSCWNGQPRMDDDVCSCPMFIAP